MVASCVPHAYHGQLVIKYKSCLIKYSTDVRCIPDPFFYIPDHSPTFIRLKLEYIPTITRLQTLTSYYKTNHTRFLIMWHPSTRGPTRVRLVQTLLDPGPRGQKKAYALITLATDPYPTHIAPHKQANCSCISIFALILKLLVQIVLRRNPSENWVILIFSGPKPCTRII